MDIFDFDNSLLNTDGEFFDDGLDFSDSDFDVNNYVLEQSMEPYSNIAFGASENADGFIREGQISLERTVSGSSDTFEHYTKEGHDYIKIGNRYIQVDKGDTVTINNIKYDTV